MAKVLFFSIPAHGHTNPTIPMVRELVARGEEVYYYSTQEFAEKIAATGAYYKAYPLGNINIDIIQTGKNIAVLYYTLLLVAQSIIDELLGKVSRIKPDYIIHDSICVWGRYIAKICGIPAITSVTTFAFDRKGVNLIGVLTFIKKVGIKGVMGVIRAGKIQSNLRKKYGVKALDFIGSMMNEEALNIVFSSRLFQPQSNDFDDARYKFVGPSLSERINDPDTTDYSILRRPLVYVSMGTIWKEHLNIDEFIAALVGLNGTLVFSNNLESEKFAGIPHVIIKKHVNQIEILKHCDAFITHGGMNSVSEGLYWQVPLCVYPFQLEQAEVARRVVELGCGIQLKKLDKHSIREGVLRVLHDKSYKENCVRVSDSFKEAGGYLRAVDCILGYRDASAAAIDRQLLGVTPHTAD